MLCCWSAKLYSLTHEQCDSSYGFSVIVRVTVTDFIIFQLELQLKLHMHLLE